MIWYSELRDRGDLSTNDEMAIVATEAREVRGDPYECGDQCGAGRLPRGWASGLRPLADRDLGKVD